MLPLDIQFGFNVTTAGEVDEVADEVGEGSREGAGAAWACSFAIF